MKEIQRMFVAKHTGIGESRPEVTQAVKIELTRHIASTLDGLQEETRYAFDKEPGSCEDWTPVVLYPKLTRIVALLSGRVFVGRPLSRQEEWIQATINFTVDSVGAKDAILKYPVFLRPFVAPFLPQIRRVKKYRAEGGKLLEPMLKASLARARHEKTYLDDMEDEQATFISWVLGHTKEENRHDPTVLANNQMVCKSSSYHVQVANTHTAIKCHSPPSTQQVWQHVKPFLIWPHDRSISSPCAMRSKLSFFKTARTSTMKVS